MNSGCSSVQNRFTKHTRQNGIKCRPNSVRKRKKDWIGIIAEFGLGQNVERDIVSFELKFITRLTKSIFCLYNNIWYTLWVCCFFLFPFPSQSNQNGKFSEKGKQYFCYRGLKCHWNLPTIFQNNFVCVRFFFGDKKNNNSNKNESTFKCGKRTYWIATDVMKWVFFSTLCCYLLISHFLQSLAKSVSL